MEPGVGEELSETEVECGEGEGAVVHDATPGMAHRGCGSKGVEVMWYRSGGARWRTAFTTGGARGLSLADWGGVALAVDMVAMGKSAGALMVVSVGLPGMSGGEWASTRDEVVIVGKAF